MRGFLENSFENVIVHEGNLILEIHVENALTGLGVLVRRQCHNEVVKVQALKTCE